MTFRPWMIVPILAAAAVPWFSCASDGGAGAAGTGGGAMQTTQSTSSTGGSGGCAAILQSGPCDDCTAQHCCAELSACNADPSCLDCFTGNLTDPTACAKGATKTALDALDACIQEGCAATCTPAPPGCNPVTNAGCAAGSACDNAADQNAQSTFSCYAPPPNNDVAVCGACDDKTTACQGGSSCLHGQCAKFCCDSGDCGSGVCTTGGPFGVGYCVTAASLDAGAPAPACDAPAVSPSQGSCLTPDAGAPPPDAGEGGAPDAGEDGATDAGPG